VKARARSAQVEIEVDHGSAPRGLIIAAFLGAACWLALGLLVLATVAVSPGWLTPLLVAAGLLVGAAIGLLPTLLYRREAKILEAALTELADELVGDAISDPRAPRKPLTVKQLALISRLGHGAIDLWSDN
jgi:hypothetical protein